ncbi:hypothetical protein [Polyangium aurulentum]|nr:hypothetical protein [Polyangium aurulentum]UQA58571.1 hypothetical protein E8A73_046275 [Polyangium aurulentum]
MHVRGAAPPNVIAVTNEADEVSLIVIEDERACADVVIHTWQGCNPGVDG